jgi:low affinity Fe/Cu permease
MTHLFTAFANTAARVVGRPYTFILCVALVVIWAASGPLVGFTDTWQLIINTSTTIITFLMVFLIQNTQNRDNAALQAKLDELIRTSKASNRFIGIEHLTDRELEGILEECEAYAEDLRAEAKERESRATSKRTSESA